MISQLIAEATDVEYKVAVETARPKSWPKTVSAFANTAGGTILFGVDDDTHDPVGLENPQGDVEMIGRLIRDRIDSLPRFRIDTPEERPGIVIVSVTIELDMQKPHYYHADGRHEAFVRVSESSITAPSEILNELVPKGTNRTYDGLSTEIPLGNASFTVLRATYRQRTSLDFTDSDFISFGLVDGDRNLANAGALLADEPLVRHSRIFCTRWDGLFKDAALDDAEYSGGLLTLLREGDKTDQVTDQVAVLLSALGEKELSAVELMEALSLSHRPTFRTNYLNPDLESGLIEQTISDKPNSRLQKYRRTR